MTIQVELDTPLLLDTETGETTESLEILAIRDELNLQQLAAFIQLRPYPGLYETVILYQMEDYEALGNWSYTDIIDRVKDYYANERGAISAPPEPVEEIAPEGE